MLDELYLKISGALDVADREFNLALRAMNADQRKLDNLKGEFDAWAATRTAILLSFGVASNEWTIAVEERLDARMETNRGDA